MNSIIDIRNSILGGEITSKEVTERVIRKIKDSDLNCFITVCEDAVFQAEKMDELIGQGFRGKLAGVPIAVKDNMRLKGYRTTCGSSILSDIDDIDCEVVKRLKEQGAVIVGKTNMDEFAMGSSNTTSAFGNVLNPVDRTRVPGGSSGGSAAAVAAGLCFGALGSDTGGSIRQPASYCGVVGLKPTYGSINGEGMYALSQSMDQVGPITKTVADNELLFEVLSGRTLDKPLLRDIRIGVINEYSEWYNDALNAVMRRAEEVLGCKFHTVSVPSVKAAFTTYTVLGNAEAANNIRSLGTLESRGNLGKEVRKRILIGEYVLAHPGYIHKAQAVRERIRREFDEALNEYDIIVSPSAPSVAFEFGADRSRKEIIYSDLFTQPPSIAGLPAISVPCVEVEGLPIGVQLVGRNNSENVLFELAELFEKYNNLK